MKLTKKEELAREKVCHPLDGLEYLKTKDEKEGKISIESRVKELSPVVGLFKIGKESFTRFGPDAVKLVKDYGSDVFIDLKYHDIPKTVKGASCAIAEKSIWMFNVHASGGREMMEYAVEGIQKAAKEYNISNPIIIGVTVLTSIGPAEYLDINKPLVPNLSNSDLSNYLGIKTEDTAKQEDLARLLIKKGYQHLTIDDDKGLRCNVVEQQVLNLALMSMHSGLDGIVCSAADLYAIKDELPNNFMYVTPGIKGPNTPAGEDQKRVFTPGNAVKDGSSILVIGRTITDPRTKEQKDKSMIITPDMRIQSGYEILQDMALYL